MFQRIHIIINPAAGQVEPILTYLNKAFHKERIEWDVSITHKQGDGTRLAKAALKKKYDLICVYGGDGTIMEVAKALHKTGKAMGIIPGGTANVMAKELGIPIDSQQAIEFLTTNNIKVQTIDMGLCNGELFFIRITIGDFAQVVLDATRTLKDAFGQAAYGITTAKNIIKEGTNKYIFKIKGKKIEYRGASLMVINSGNIGFENASLTPKGSVSDGFLDVILFKDTAFMTMASLAGNILLNNKPQKNLKQWKVKNIDIDCVQHQPIIVDDISVKAKNLSISVIPNSLQIIVPKKK